MRELTNSSIRILIIPLILLSLLSSCGSSDDQAVTAQKAFASAQRVTQEWQTDAWLYLVETTLEADQQTGKAVFWQFYFVSPSANRILSVVTKGRRVVKLETRLLSEQRADDTLPLASRMFSDAADFWRFDTQSWKIDSSKALRIAQTHVNADYSNSRFQIVLILSRYPGLDNDSLVWQVFYKISENPLDNPIVVINATTGEFIEVL